MDIKKHAFTLAEVLMAMVIIGIIAALTVPAIITNVFAQAHANNAKNIIATIEQLATDELVTHRTRFLSSTDFAAVDTLLSDDHFEISDNCPNNCNADNGYFMINGHAAAANQFDNQTLTLKNGAKITYTVDGNDDVYGTFVVDGNGDDRPNTIGRDIYSFTIDIQGHVNTPQGTVGGCSDGDAIQCTGVLMANSWRVPDGLR